MNHAADMDLSGKTALITGSVSGLGNALADGLARAGARVILNGLCSRADGEAAAGAIADRHGTVVRFDPANLNARTEIETMMSAAQEQDGGVDILVNNAVVRHFSRLEDFDPDKWDHSVRVNLTAAFHTSRLALPSMKHKGWGRIINMSSAYGWRGAEDRIDYVTTKTGLIGMTRAIALETATTGITCNAICPGSVPTQAILDKIAHRANEMDEPYEDAVRRYAAERSPTGRFVALESVAAMAVFLCSRAGSDITGSSLPVDGGWLAS